MSSVFQTPMPLMMLSQTFVHTSSINMEMLVQLHPGAKMKLKTCLRYHFVNLSTKYSTKPNYLLNLFNKQQIINIDYVILKKHNVFNKVITEYNHGIRATPENATWNYSIAFFCVVYH